MSDIMISYASSDRDRARALSESLTSAGQSVWIDDVVKSGTEGSVAGIPGGQQHWSVIRSAIDEAGCVVVLDSPAWRRSAYCQQEFNFARDAGKRIVVASDSDVPAMDGVFCTVVGARTEDILDHLARGNDAASAHARLLLDMRRAGQSAYRRVSRSHVRDAQLLSTAPIRELGLSVPQDMAAHIATVLRAGRRNRQRLQIIGVVVVVAALGLAVASVIARQRAAHSRAVAQDRADFSASLESAQRAGQSNVTAQSLALATRAVHLDDNAASQAALRAAQSNSYRATATVTPGLAVAAAVSNNGRTALIAQSATLLVVDAAGGRSASIPVRGGLGPRLAITPDGRTGFAKDGAGRLVCIDVDRRLVTPTTQQGIVDLQVGSDGVLWWLTTHGDLYRSTSCPVDHATKMASAVAGVRAFAVSPAPRRLYAVTTTGHVEVHALPAAGGSLGAALADVDVAGVRRDGGTVDIGAPAQGGTAYVTLCGDTVHALLPVRYSLSSSTHVAFDLAGRPLTPRSSNTSMFGLGCAPDGEAWAAPLLNSRAVPLPSDARYPAEVIDARDRSARIVLADSSDSSHTVVAHSDGRVDVLTVARLPWGQPVGRAAVAVPLGGAIVTIDMDGAVTKRTDGHAQAMGSIGGTPVPSTVAMPGAALVARGRYVYAISQRGVHRSAALPGDIQSIAATDGGRRILAEGGSWAAALPTALDDAPDLLTMPHLVFGEHATSVALDGDRQIVTTDYGRVYATDRSGQIIDRVGTGVAGSTSVVVLRNHDIVVAGGSGVLQRLSRDLHPLRSKLFGTSAVSLQASADGRTLLVGLSGQYTVWAVDATSLLPLVQVDRRSPDVRLVCPAADGRSIVRLVRGTGTSPSRMESVRVG